MIRADIIYNNVAGREVAVALATRPSVPPPQMRGSWIDLGAVDGSMLSTDYTYENITIEAELNFMMKTLLGGKIKDGLDKVVDALVAMSEGRMPEGFDPSMMPKA